MTESGEPLTADVLVLNTSSFRPTIMRVSSKADKRIQLEWAQIPHFYYDFYVYKYATGFSAAAAFSKNILSGIPQNRCITGLPQGRRFEKTRSTSSAMPSRSFKSRPRRGRPR
jgi:oligoendopeptidase F